MKTTITCSGCEATYTLPDAFSAPEVRCRKCGAAIEVRAADPPDPAPAARKPSARPETGGLRSRMRSLRERRSGPPYYRQPVFYVGVAALIVCGYFAVKFR